MAFMMTRGDSRESWVVGMRERLEDGAGRVTQRRVYTMENGDVLEVIWSGEDKHVCFNRHVSMSLDAFGLELRRQGRRSGKGGAI